MSDDTKRPAGLESGVAIAARHALLYDGQNLPTRAGYVQAVMDAARTADDPATPGRVVAWQGTKDGTEYRLVLLRAVPDAAIGLGRPACVVLERACLDAMECPSWQRLAADEDGYITYVDLIHHAIAAALEALLPP